MIILNTGRAQFEPKSTMSIAALHEALGGLGYEDENYQISLLLHIQTLSDLERNTIFKEEDLQKEYASFSNLARRSSNVHYLMAGGGTSVGGGGDGIVVQIKWYLLMFAPRICELSNRTCKNILHRLLHATIEINPQVLETAVRTERLPSKNIIRVPMINWLNGNIRTGESSLNDDQLRILQQIVMQVDQL